MRGLIRPAAVLFPLAGLIAMAAGGGELPGLLLHHYYIVQLCTLCAVDSFRNGAAREPGVRRVDRRLGGALAQLVLGGLLLGLTWFGAGLHKTWNAGMLAAAGCVTLEQLFEERMYALGRHVDGALLSVIANVLLAAGLLLDGAQGIALAAGGVDCLFTLGLAALGALIAIGACYALEPAHGFSPAPVNLAQAPRACAQTLLYPAAALGIFMALQKTISETSVAAPLFWGMLLWRLARTVCRRNQEESRPLNLLLCAGAALPVVLACAWPELTLCGAPVAHFAAESTLAVVCAGIVFCAPGARIWLGILLLIAGQAIMAFAPLPGIWNVVVGIACALAAVALNLHRAFMKRASRGQMRF